MTKAKLEEQVKELQEKLTIVSNERNLLSDRLKNANEQIVGLSRSNKELIDYVEKSKSSLRVLMKDIIAEEIKTNLQLKEGKYDDYYSNGSVIELYYKEQNLGQVSITTERWSED